MVPLPAGILVIMVNIRMEDSCCGEMHQCRSSQGDRKRIQHLIWLNRLIIVVLLLVCSVLVMLVYTLHYSVSKQNFPPQDNHMGGSTEKQQQMNANSNALLTASKTPNTDANLSLKWEHDIGNAHLGTFTFNGTDLIVPRDGTYRIYLQITYSNLKDVNDLNFQLLKFGMDYPLNVILLSCYDTLDIKSGHQKSLYTAATFNLKLNDRLKVITNQPQHIVQCEHTTFFGAELIS